MRRITAFLTAFLLFLGTVAGVHFFSLQMTDFHNPKFGTWVSANKFRSGETITANLDKDSIVVFGSSEFSHGRKTKYHPGNMFAGQNFHMMLVGAGYYQSLSHAIELAAMEPQMEKRKVVLVLSPQWFRKSGVLPEAFANRFSEENYINMLKNSSISQETKSFMVTRTEELLKKDPKELKRVNAMKRVLLTGDCTAWDRGGFVFYDVFLRERSRVGIRIGALVGGIERRQHMKRERPVAINWELYQKEAEADGAKLSTSNPFYIKDSVYRLLIKPRIERKKNSSLNGGYVDSKEYNDLRCFLDICKERSIEPLLVMIPVNGYWYDYTGFPKESREGYYSNIRALAAEYDVSVSDLSKNEYTKHFFEDNIHIGWKGWVSVNEAIYNFAKKDQ